MILKNPTDKMAALGDPSISRVTIIDDDREPIFFYIYWLHSAVVGYSPFETFVCFSEPGEIQFEKSHFYVGAKSGTLVAKIIRENGSDGDISVDYKTMCVVLNRHLDEDKI